MCCSGCPIAAAVLSLRYILTMAKNRSDVVETNTDVLPSFTTGLSDKAPNSIKLVVKVLVKTWPLNFLEQ